MWLRIEKEETSKMQNIDCISQNFSIPLSDIFLKAYQGLNFMWKKNIPIKYSPIYIL